MKKITKELDILDWSLKRIVNEDLGLQPFNIQQRELLSSASKQKWLGRGKKNVGDAACCRQSLHLIEWGIFHCEGCGLHHFTRKHPQRCQNTFQLTETNWYQDLSCCCVWCFEIAFDVHWRSERELQSLLANFGEKCIALVVNHIWKLLYLHSRLSFCKQGQFDAELVQ